MATVKAVVLKHQKREDDTWNVKIRITHERKTAYLATSHYITVDLINKKTFEIKERNNPVYDQVMLDVLKIRSELSALGNQIDCYTAKGLVELMNERLTGKDKGIRFFDFAERNVRDMEEAGKRRSQSYHAMLTRLEEYAGRNILFSDITASFLTGFDTYLRNKESRNGTGKISQAGVRLYIGIIQTLFNKAKLEYNDEDRGLIRISNNPFAKYKLPSVPKTRKRAISPEQIRAIKELKIPINMHGTLIARDVFILSFLLCGMNTVDMYYLDTIRDGRIEYCRRKTENRREDNAFISIKIEPEAEPYFDRYKDMLGDRVFNFFTRYSSDKQFITKVNGNLKWIGEQIGIDGLTFYAARHTWATIARNECGVSMDDVAMALNHKSGYDVTDTYIKKDWSRIDKANRKVIDFVFAKEKPED